MKKVLIALLITVVAFVGCEKEKTEIDLTKSVVGKFKDQHTSGPFSYYDNINKIDNSTISFKSDWGGFTIQTNMQTDTYFTFDSPYTNTSGERDTVRGNCSCSNNVLTLSYTRYYYQGMFPSEYISTTSTRIP